MPAELIELSPAKLNLFLKIITKRKDGYHNLRSGVTLINIFVKIFIILFFQNPEIEFLLLICIHYLA